MVSKNKKINPTLGFILTLLLLLIVSCGNDKPIQGFDLTEINQRGRIDSTAIKSIVLEKSFGDIVSPTGKSIYLSLGAFNDIETQILLRFNPIADTLAVNSATIILHTHAILGDSTGSFTASAHQVLTDWNEDTVTVSTIGDMFDPNPVGSAEVFPTVGDSLNKDSLRIEIDTQLVNSWKDTTLAKRGVLIGFSNSGFIKEFFSRENTSNRPQLEIIYNKSGSGTDTTAFTAAADAFLARSVRELPPGPLYVGNAIRHQSVIKFDLSDIPREATINRAHLELMVQKENSLLKKDGILLQLLRLNEPYQDQNSVRLDSNLVISKVRLGGSASSILIDLRVFVQEWTLERFDNNGFIIRPETPSLDVSRVAFFSTEMDSSLAPKVRIDFTLPPEGL